ncbi:MAG: alpha-hydroxy-acid oxidizing protein [Deltaproteobacteria bacterium]|nr:alpha-hydroxy-acid oxidizing protein [Deltaproteobacteria bacterium]MBW2051132.1 alpha-hydroxy-acid oxidizing protein [Deltaproteobacteria bacterium]MBW2140728.1 alpha-hydroxy-acid oxidizing protein [Deltaproteobacteria bacterium]MBW2322853.1 alpha-hydroxy-acid oxidizing protein [Deltaproteobacteria bacterium]
MNLSELYEKGERVISEQSYGLLLEGVETGFVLANNRRVMERYTFRQSVIDASEATTKCQVLGVELGTPVIMSALTMPIPAIAENGLMKVALGLKETGSLMWTGTPVPGNLKEIAATGVPLASTVKPFKDRKKIFEELERFQDAGVTWAGVEIDVGYGTKIKDRPIVSDCAPLSLAELKEIRKAVSGTLIFKGVLSGIDASKSIEAGADAIVASNHGAHTLDYLPHPFQVMEEIMEVARGNTVVIVDGGFRRGSDVIKGLALGASLVGLGRPVLYALAADGQNGIQSLITEITAELSRIMALVGAKDPASVNQDILIRD